MLNQCQFIGNLAADVEVRSFQSGGRVANFRIGVSEKWKDKQGEAKERTEWVSVTVYSDGLVGVAERYLRKGSRVFISGKIHTRKWQDQSGNDRYSTEIVLQGYDAKLVMLDKPEGSNRQQDGNSGHRYEGQSGHVPGYDPRTPDDLDDSVPF